MILAVAYATGDAPLPVLRGLQVGVARALGRISCQRFRKASVLGRCSRLRLPRREAAEGCLAGGGIRSAAGGGTKEVPFAPA